VHYPLEAKVIVLQHERADAVQQLPYLSTRFRGVPIREMLGRCAKLSPECKMQEAVFYGWRVPGMNRVRSEWNAVSLVFCLLCIGINAVNHTDHDISLTRYFSMIPYLFGT